MEELLAVLREVDEDIDWEKETALFDDDVLDSFLETNLIAELEDHYDIRIAVSDILPDNFNSAEQILALVNRLQEEQN